MPLRFLLFLPLFCLPLSAQKGDEPVKPPKEVGPEFRTFTSANGKTLVAKVIAAFDDETYTFETPDGKTYRMARSSFCKSDRQWLEFWEPEFAIDLSTLRHDEALEKMGYAAIKTRNPEIGMVVEVTIGEAELKLLVDPKAKNTILDIEPADRAGLKITESSSTFRDAAGNTTQAKQATNVPFTFGDTKPVEATVLVVNLAQVGVEKIQQEADGILGGDLLPRFNALLDFATGTLYVKP